MHAVFGAERVGAGQAFDRRADRDGAGADDELVVADQLLFAVGVLDEYMSSLLRALR